MFDRHIVRTAAWLSKPVGFLATCGAVGVGLGFGVGLAFNDHWALVFNLVLSIASFMLTGLVLVAGAHDTLAIHVKLDAQTRASAASNATIRLEDLTDAEILAAREKC